MARRLYKALAVIIIVGGALLASLSAPPAFGQIRSSETSTDASVLRNRLQQRFQILPLANGVLLTPKFRTPVRSVEVTDVIAVDGATVSGSELRDKLGADADLVLQASYLDAAARRSLSGAASPAASATPAPSAPSATPAPPDSNTRSSRQTRRDDVVRVGGNVTVGEGEIVDGDVVAIGGSVDIDGEVHGEAVSVGGSVTLGPHANIHGDVTVVGGALNKDPNAVIGGKVSEVGFGGLFRGRRGGWFPGPMRGWRYAMPALGVAGTIVRVALVMLLAGIVLLVAHTHVAQIADRAAAEPVKSWAVGFLIEILFVPVLVLTVFVLAVSIVGIPLLLLIPVAILAAMIVSLIGFTSVAFHLGRLVETRFEQVRNRPYLATIAGIALIVSPLLVARIIGLIPGLGFIAGVLIAAGFVLEYIAWTTGLGAVALTRFGRPAAPAPAAIAPVAQS